MIGCEYILARLCSSHVYHIYVFLFQSMFFFFKKQLETAEIAFQNLEQKAMDQYQQVMSNYGVSTHKAVQSQKSMLSQVT